LFFKNTLPSRGSFTPSVGESFGKLKLKVFVIIDEPFFGTNGQSGTGNEKSLFRTGTERTHGFPHAAQENVQSTTFFN